MTGGIFHDTTQTLASGLAETGLVTSAVFSDADGDGWMDLLVTHEWGPVKFYHNDHGRFVEQTLQAGLAGLSGLWNGIAAVDLEGDGDMDYVVTNLGLNTPYRASHTQPMLGLIVRLGGQERFIEACWRGSTPSIRSAAGTPFLPASRPGWNGFPAIRASLPPL